MTWQYELKWWKDDVRGGNKGLKSVIFVQSKPKNLGTFGLIDVWAWINNDESNDSVTPDQPLVIYASVTRGNSPVLNAKVSVQVEVGREDGSFQKLNPITLHDNGNGGKYHP